MTRFIIIANGRMEITPNIDKLLQSSTMIIAADGGIKNCQKLGILPNVLIGDLDSVQSNDIQMFRAAGVDILQYPSRKDETDLDLALQYAIKKNVQEIIILGGLGARWDMTVANILLLAHPHLAKVNIKLLDGKQELFLLRAGVQSMITGEPGNTVSLIPICGDALGITTHGLEYPLKNEDLHFGATRGVSNVFAQETADIYFEAGLLLCVLSR